MHFIMHMALIFIGKMKTIIYKNYEQHRTFDKNMVSYQYY